MNLGCRLPFEWVIYLDKLVYIPCKSFSYSCMNLGRGKTKKPTRKSNCFIKFQQCPSFQGIGWSIFHIVWPRNRALTYPRAFGHLVIFASKHFHFFLMINLPIKKYFRHYLCLSLREDKNEMRRYTGS